MKIYSWGEFERIMYQHNVDNGITVKGVDKHPLIGVVVYKQGDYFRKEYTEKERSYRVSSDNKAFIPGQMGSSIFADCLDDVDTGVRLDWYKEWVIDYCYFEENDK